MRKNIGFISTRFAGTDGVTMEASKWAQVLREMGHDCWWFAGKLDKDPGRSMLVEEAFFQHTDNQWINDRILSRKHRDPSVTDAIQESKNLLKHHIRAFIRKFDIDLIVSQNALTIPMHIPLGMALTEVIAETLIPTIAHHHDFYWERTRFSVNAVNDYLRMAFPPNLPGIEHVVINSAAQEELALRTGIAAITVPNILDFEHPPDERTGQRRELREALGFDDTDIVFLQPTRIVQRKGIEHAIELIQALDDPRCKLLISHEAGDEGFEYADWLKQEALNHGVDLRALNTSMRDPWNDAGNGSPAPSLLDIYPCADFITYPSLYEGFGNAFLEAVYFRKPVLINRYAIFVRDIEPKGFDLIAMDGFLTRRTIESVKHVLFSADRREQMVAHNYQIAAKNYSYTVLRRWLKTLLINLFGMENGA
jgi:glycosyltransferase involved in cell wall biosynthesis